METLQRFTAPNLDAALKAQGRTKRWVANQIGVHESMIGHAISGRRSLSEPMAREIARLIGVPFTTLFEVPTGTNMGPMEQAA